MDDLQGFSPVDHILAELQAYTRSASLRKLLQATENSTEQANNIPASVTAVMPTNDVPVDVGESPAPAQRQDDTASIGAAPVILHAPNAADDQVATITGNMEPTASSATKPDPPKAEPAVLPSPSPQPTAAYVDSSSWALFGSAWDSAPACSHKPSKEISVQGEPGVREPCTSVGCWVPNKSI